MFVVDLGVLLAGRGKECQRRRVEIGACASAFANLRPDKSTLAYDEEMPSPKLNAELAEDAERILREGFIAGI